MKGEGRSLKSWFLVLVGLFVVTGVFTYRMGLLAIRDNQKIETRASTMNELANFLSTFEDAETDQRGFLLTDDASYLESYRQSLAQLKIDENKLRGLVASGDLPHAEVEQTIALTEEKLAELEQRVQLRKRGLAAALTFMRDRDKQITDAIRSEITRLQSSEQRLFVQARRQADRAFVIRAATFTGMGLIYLAFLAWAFRKLSREEHHRETTVQEITRQKELLDTTLASIGDAVIVTGAEGRVTFLNREAERLTDWKTPEAREQPLPAVFKIINEKTRQSVENPVDKVSRLGTVTGLANHTILVSKNGRETPIDDSAAPIRERNGPISGTVLVFRDCTEQRRNALLFARLSAIVEHSGDAIISKNLDGIIQTWNAAAQRLLGYRPEEIIGKSILTIIPPERHAEEDEILGRIRSGKVMERFETIRLTRDERRIHVWITASPLKDPDGRVIGASKIMRDMSDIVAAQDALMREKELLKTTLTSIGDAVIVTDTESRIKFLNGEAERLTGWKISEARGEFLPVVFKIINEKTRQSLESPVKKALRLGTVSNLANHTILISKDGRETSIEDSVAPIREPDGPITGTVLVFHDCTEQRKAEEATVRLAAIVENSGDAIITKTLDGIIQTWNPGAERLLGYTSAEIVGKPIQTIMPPDRFAEEDEILNHLRQGQPVKHLETIRLAKDGRRIPVSLSVSHLRNAEGQIIGASSIAHDITERNLAEMALARQRRLYESVLNNTPDLAYIFGLDHRFIYANQVLLKLWGKSWDEANGRNCLELGYPRWHAEMHDRELDQVIATKQPVRGEVPFTGTFGRRIYEYIFAPVLDENKEVTAVAGTTRDITELTIAREALAQEKELLATTLASIGDGVIVTDAEGRITFINGEAERLTGWTMSEARGELLPVVFKIVNEQTREPAKNPVEKVLQSGKVAGLANHTILISKDGRETPIDDSAAPIHADDEPVFGVVLIFRDFTKQREAQRVLTRSKEELENLVVERTVKLQEMVDELQHVSYAIAHDMRAPLRAMNIFAEKLLEQESGAISAQGQNYLKRIIIAGSRFDRLIKDALYYTKAVQLELPLESVDLSKLITGIIETYPNLQGDVADVQIEGKLPAVIGNESFLIQCFSNLLGNAVKFVAPGVKPRVRVAADVSDSIARIWIKDNGIGIPEHAQRRLFKMFQKLDDKYEGTGIGLAVVRKVVSRMAGKVGVESEAKHGSKFWVELPLA